jgi:hypothetical protein
MTSKYGVKRLVGLHHNLVFGGSVENTSGFEPIIGVIKMYNSLGIVDLFRVVSSSTT